MRKKTKTNFNDAAAAAAVAVGAVFSMLFYQVIVRHPIVSTSTTTLYSPNESLAILMILHCHSTSKSNRVFLCHCELTGSKCSVMRNVCRSHLKMEKIHPTERTFNHYVQSLPPHCTHCSFQQRRFR